MADPVGPLGPGNALGDGGGGGKAAGGSGWFTPRRLLLLFCTMCLFIYLDRGEALICMLLHHLQTRMEGALVDLHSWQA